MENLINIKKGIYALKLFIDDFDESQSGVDLRSKVFNILSSDKIEQLVNFMEKKDLNLESLRWEEYDKKSYKIKNNLRHIFKSLSFTTPSRKSLTPLYKAIIFLQDYLKNNRKKMKNPPLDFIPAHQK